MEMPTLEQPNVCLMTRQRFAHLSGLGEDVVRGMISRGQLPTVKLGRYRMVNLEALRRMCRHAGEGEL
ncbi:hypothetical protein [Arhodomonas sp. AD133]|uniref:hypothetical protein n=1 Tax=Arhodomonas sp. AD133 TaxID=3415009 RepID=UPI003EBB66DA